MAALPSQFRKCHLPYQSYYRQVNLTHISNYGQPYNDRGLKGPHHILLCTGASILQARRHMDDKFHGNTAFPIGLDHLEVVQRLLMHATMVWHHMRKLWGRKQPSLSES